MEPELGFATATGSVGVAGKTMSWSEPYSAARGARALPKTALTRGQLYTQSYGQRNICCILVHLVFSFNIIDTLLWINQNKFSIMLTKFFMASRINKSTCLFSTQKKASHLDTKGHMATQKLYTTQTLSTHTVILNNLLCLCFNNPSYNDSTTYQQHVQPCSMIHQDA